MTWNAFPITEPFLKDNSGFLYNISVMRCFDVFFVVSLNKLSKKQSNELLVAAGDFRCFWIEWRHCNDAMGCLSQLCPGDFVNKVTTLEKHQLCIGVSSVWWIIRYLAPESCRNDLTSVFFKPIFPIYTLSTFREIGLRLWPRDPIDDQSILVQVMACCRQVASHYKR